MAARKADETAMDVAVRGVVDAEVVTIRREGDVIGDYLRDESGESEATAEQAYRSIIDRIMASETVSDVLGEITPMSPTDFLGKNLTVHGFVMNDSDFPTGPKVYTTVAVQPDDDEKTYIMNTSDQGFMAQLLRIKQLDGFPFRCAFKQGKMNRFNNFPIRMTNPTE